MAKETDTPHKPDTAHQEPSVKAPDPYRPFIRLSEEQKLQVLSEVKKHLEWEEKRRKLTRGWNAPIGSGAKVGAGRYPRVRRKHAEKRISRHLRNELLHFIGTSPPATSRYSPVVQALLRQE